MRLHAALSTSLQSTHLPVTSNKFKNSALLAAMLLCCSQVAMAQGTIYWDGSNTAPNGEVDGGSGTWDDASTNWTTADGSNRSAGALLDRRFSGAAGTVNITSLTAQASRIQFSTSGYRLEGEAIDVQGPLVLDANTSTTIANAFTATSLTSASTGALLIDATGTLQIDMGESVAAIAGNITNNGSLVFNRSDDLTLSNPISGSGLIRHQGTGILTLDGTGATYSGNVEVTNGTLRPFQVEILGVVTLDGGTLSELQPADPPAEIALGAGGGTINVPFVTFGTGNNISGIGKLTKTGAGELRLKGDRTFSGGMDINQGRVVFRDSPSAVTSPFGSGLITVAAGARLDLADTMSVPNAISLVETSVLRIATTFPITLSGNINFGGGSEAITLLGGTNADRTVNFSGILSNGGFVADATAISTARTLEFSGTAANTYTGLTRLQTVADAGLRFRLNKSSNVVAVPGNLTVDAGTQVVVVAHEQIVDTATVELGADAVVTLGDGSAVIETINVLSGAGAMGLTSLSEVRVASGTFSGVISGDGSLVKQSSGTLTLSGDSTYTGSTSIAAGQLRVSGSLAGAVAIASGATLSGTGTVGAVQVAGDGIVAPGASAGTLGTSGLELGATSVLNFELAAPGTVGGSVNDLIQVTGDLVLDGMLNISDLGGLAAGTYTLLTYTGTLTDNSLTLNTTPAGFIYSIDTTQANVINLVVIEQETVLTLSSTGLDFGTRGVHAAATTQTLTLSNTGNMPVNIDQLTISGDHAAEFSMTVDTCSNSELPVDGECEITISQEGNTSGLRTAQLNVPSDADDNPHVVSLQVRRVGDPELEGLDGSSHIFRLGGDPLLLDPDAEAVLSVPDAVNLDGGKLHAEIVTGAVAGEDRLSFSVAGSTSLEATTAGSDVLVDDVVIGTLDNAIAAGEILSVTFNEEATAARIQTLIQSVTYQNINSTDPVNGEREIRVTLSYLEQDVTATISVNVQQTEFVLSATELDFGNHGTGAGAVTQVLTIKNEGDIAVNTSLATVTGSHAAEFTITADTCSDSALAIDGECSITVSHTGSLSGLRTAQLNIPSDADNNPHVVDLLVRRIAPSPPVPAPPTVVTGTVSGVIAGEPGDPVTIRDATVTGDASLSHVVIGSDVILEPGVTLGEGVIFEAPGVIQSIQDIGFFVIDGATITQLADGHLSIVSDNYRAMLKPVEIVQGTAGQPAGVYYGDNADVYLITGSGLGIRAYALHVDEDGFQNSLSQMTLQQRYTSTGRIIVTELEPAAAVQSGSPAVLALQSEEIYFSGRSDLIAIPANRSDTAGLIEYPLSGLGNVHQLSSLFIAEDDSLMQQDLVSAPANWLELRDGLLELNGVTAVSIDTRGVINVTVDGINLQGVMDYTVISPVEAGSGELSLELAGDLTGNGMGDYLVIFGSGDKQYLFVFLPE